jgi:uroporphyrinogen-III decarboxylase
MTSLTSRQRMLRAFSLQEVDHIPCAFMSFTALRKRFNEDLYRLANAEVEMGLDSYLFIPSLPRQQRGEHPELRGLPVRPHPSVQIRERREGDTLFKEIITPGGNLATSVRISDDWPHDDHIPFIDDFQVPRATQRLVNGPQDLPALSYLLTPPTQEDAARYRAEIQRAQSFTEGLGIALVGGWGVGMDMINWLCGMQELMAATMQQEDFVGEVLEMITRWNIERMRLVLSAPIDLYIKRAWYEGCDFVTPGFYRRQILPRLKREVDLAHEHGVKFGYICSSGLEPMLDLFLESGIDVLIGIDPLQGRRTDMRRVKERIGERICVWGGVSGAITVELGSEDDVRTAIRTAITTLGPRGLVLSPVDNITVDAPLTWQNIDIFLDEWRKSWLT